MISASRSNKRRVRSFRTKLLTAMMLVVSGLMAFALYFAQRHVTAAAQHDLQQDFQAELSSLDKVQELRNAALAERCSALALRPRIHAALEDNALDLLYPSAKDELRDLMEDEGSLHTGPSLHAKFYRFLDAAGAVLSPPNPKDVGQLSSWAETQLILKKLPEAQQIGYIRENAGSTDETVDEVVAVPIFSTETGDVISALVVGFKAFELIGKSAGAGTKSGIWLNDQLHMPSLSKSAQAALGSEIAKAVTNSASAQSNFTVTVNGAPQLLFYKRLNPNSLFPPAYEICVYPLADSMAQLHRLRWRIGGAGALLLLGGFVASHFVAARLAVPVEKLELDSEKNRAQRKHAETALVSTSEKLQRSTRYSADASHQLKSPVTVLRAGLEGLLARDDFKPEIYEELSALLHHTHRLTGVIDDLLLLSRVDAGHLQIDSQPVNLSQIIEENLLENARKYNRPNGLIRVTAARNRGEVMLTIGNTGHPIARDAQEHVFERFHRGGTGSHISGHGLGLNLARELARLHDGDLRLICSQDDWTEFEARFLIAAQPRDGATQTP